MKLGTELYWSSRESLLALQCMLVRVVQSRRVETVERGRPESRKVRLPVIIVARKAIRNPNVELLEVVKKVTIRSRNLRKRKNRHILLRMNPRSYLHLPALRIMLILPRSLIFLCRNVAGSSTVVLVVTSVLTDRNLSIEPLFLACQLPLQTNVPLRHSGLGMCI